MREAVYRLAYLGLAPVRERENRLIYLNFVIVISPVRRLKKLVSYYLII